MKQKIPRWMNRLTGSAWIAYAGIILLQAKVMLWIWDYRDLIPGETSSYYPRVFTWLDEAKLDLAWSPIYTLFLSGLHSMTGNPFWTLIIAQLSVAICATVLILALMRRLLPHYVAWIIAAWWASLPINFDTAHNVHLFSALFPLAIFFIAASTSKSVYGRGFVLAGLLLTAGLVLNKYILLFGLWLLAIVAYEVSLYRKDKAAFSLRSYLCAYGLPLLLVILTIGILSTRSTQDYSGIKAGLQTGHSQTLSEAYKLNRLQMGEVEPDSRSFLQRDFGHSTITPVRALSLNSHAFLEHIWWNIKLIPSAMQLALSNYYTGGHNPDNMPAKHSFLAWIPYLYVLGFSAFALVTYFILPALRRQPIANMFPWLLMLSTALLVLGEAIIRRPGPSSMFQFSIFIMALTGIGMHGVFDLIGISRSIKTWSPLAGMLLILLVPVYYNADYINHYGYQGQVLRDTYERVAPHVARASMTSPSILATPFGDYESLCNYLGVSCRTLYGENKSPGGTMSSLVAASPKANVYLLYLEKMIWEVSAISDYTSLPDMDYIELECFTLANNVMTCSDGTIDLNRGVMNDGTVDIPLRSALFVNNGYIVDKKDYRNKQGYYLQILVQDTEISMVLVANEQLFRTPINQQFLLGNYDLRYFEEMYNQSPEIRVLKLKSPELRFN